MNAWLESQAERHGITVAEAKERARRQGKVLMARVMAAEDEERK